MKLHSTRGGTPTDFFKAIMLGLADNGGLFVPAEFPDLSLLSKQTFANYKDFSVQFLSSILSNELPDVSLKKLIESALNFPLHTKKLKEGLSVLELFHGPTLSFKDFGARFLAQCLKAQGKKLCLLVATSGDTGSAVASSFYNIENINVIILFPKGKVSKRQQAQLTCWGKNILALEVDGVFDDCQSLVKKAFADEWFQSSLNLSTANSINIGRLLPQMTYYAYQSIQHLKQTGNMINFVVPSGNLGNVTACLYAKQMNFPIGHISIATNANKALVNYYQKGEFQSLPTIQTLANAMDIGAPRSFERLNHLFKSHSKFIEELSVYSVSDENIINAISDCYDKYQYIICPHTATAYHVANHYMERPQCIVSTAHPSKFERVIEPIINKTMPVPEKLKDLLQLSQKYSAISPNLSALKKEVGLFLKIDC